jgi:hypothetical protein
MRVLPLYKPKSQAEIDEETEILEAFEKARALAAEAKAKAEAQAKAEALAKAEADAKAKAARLRLMFVLAVIAICIALCIRPSRTSIREGVVPYQKASVIDIVLHAIGFS